MNDGIFFTITATFSEVKKAKQKDKKNWHKSSCHICLNSASTPAETPQKKKVKRQKMKLIHRSTTTKTGRRLMIKDVHI
jgi:type IV secretory pathway VirD2 relaxase